MRVGEQKEWLDRWYGHMKNQQQEKADNLKSKIDARLNEFTDPEMKKLYDLLKIRYYLMKEDFDRIAVALEETGLEENKYHWLNYYYYFFHGSYHYGRKEYTMAIDFYNLARLFISDIPLEETAELYYKLAAACNRTYEFSRSIKYAERALEVFTTKFLYKRMADCENLLGLNNHDIQQYKEAEQRYLNALVYVEKTRDELLKLRILHNLGYLYTRKNEPKTALDYLNQVDDFLDWKKDDFQDNYLRAQNFYLLAESYFKLDQSDRACEILNLGLAVSKREGNLGYFHRFNLLKGKFVQPDCFDLVYKEGISYYKDHERWELVDEYGDELAFYYRKKENHKEAAEYFQLAADARNQMKKERMVYHDEKSII